MNALSLPHPDFMAEEDISMFSDSVARWIDEHAGPEKVARWIAASSVPRELWNEAGRAGLLCLSMPEEWGGMGGDYRHEVVLMDQLGWKGADHFGISLHNAIVSPYVLHYGSDEQKARWLPKLASGELVGAIAMTEPGAGSDLQGVRTTAVRQGDHYVLNGSKTFITNGQQANFIIVVAKTDPAEGAKGISLICVETDGLEGFERGRNLHKIGMEANDTSELFFNDVRVPVENLIGESEGRGFYHLMEQLPQERLNIAVQGCAAAERGLRETLAYVKERKAFGRRVIDFQNTQFKLAEVKTKLTVARVFVNHCIGLHLKGQLDAATASMAKYWVTDIQNETIDEMLQLFGGYGYMTEYPIAQLYKDARVQRIYGGTNEIMKLLIARTL
ncbi:MAG: acyl-CoA dehydrogenase family protein [Brevundimonas sp.]|jgi:acyl-CoA dehydrogenase|uniref:acyl-CoA dehydrogenase family protein n=1 Tax=Brevundimonas sp. TaxID=1871086 RepID=UPI00391A9661